MTSTIEAKEVPAVALIANVLVALVVAIHVYIVILEMFLWRTERGMQAFGTDQAFADRSAPLAANQGLYNGFLVAGLVWGLIAADPIGFQVKVFFLACVVIAGSVRRGDGEPPHPRRAGSPRRPCPGGCRGRSQHGLTARRSLSVPSQEWTPSCLSNSHQGARP